MARYSDSDDAPLGLSEGFAPDDTTHRHWRAFVRWRSLEKAGPDGPLRRRCHIHGIGGAEVLVQAGEFSLHHHLFDNQDYQWKFRTRVVELIWQREAEIYNVVTYSHR